MAYAPFNSPQAKAPEPQNKVATLETRLANDPQGVERDRLVGLLNAEAFTQKKQLDRGVSPAEYALIDKQFKSVTTGIQMIELVWKANQSWQ